MRSRVVAYGCLAAGGVLGTLASASPWWRAGGADVEFSGSESTGGLSQALAMVALAGLLLALTLRTRGKRVLASLLALLGLGMGAVGLLRSQPTVTEVRTRLRQTSLGDDLGLTVTAWPALYAAAGLLLLGGAAVTALRASRWPSRAGRFDGAYEARTQQPPDPSDPTALWWALDAGVDPTAGDHTSAAPAQGTQGANLERPHGHRRDDPDVRRPRTDGTE